MFFSIKNEKKFAYMIKKQYFCGLIGKNAFIDNKKLGKLDIKGTN